MEAIDKENRPPIGYRVSELEKDLPALEEKFDKRMGEFEEGFRTHLEDYGKVKDVVNKIDRREKTVKKVLERILLIIATAVGSATVYWLFDILKAL